MGAVYFSCEDLFCILLEGEGADVKEAITKSIVADRIKASLTTEGFKYVRLREGESCLKPAKVAKALQTFEQAKGKGSAAKPATPYGAPPRPR